MLIFIGSVVRCGELLLLVCACECGIYEELWVLLGAVLL